MSKTVDDLVKVYIIAHFGADNGPRNRERYRAGIAAVIRALAPDDDEIAAYNRLSYKVQDQLKCECEYLPEDRCIRCSVVDALKCLETRYYEILGDAGNDPAPAVCEWTREHNRPGSGWLDCEGNRHWIKSECPCCGLPIKFTEAK